MNIWAVLYISNEKEHIPVIEQGLELYQAPHRSSQDGSGDSDPKSAALPFPLEFIER